MAGDYLVDRSIATILGNWNVTAIFDFQVGGEIRKSRSDYWVMTGFTFQRHNILH